MSDITKANPGSKEAIEQGCLCPVADNNNGLGVSLNGGEPLFWYDSDCPVHCLDDN